MINFTTSKQPSDRALRKRLIRIAYKFDASNIAKLVKIKVLSLNGSEIVYNSITEPGQTVVKNARVIGDALAQVFIGTELYKEYEFKSGVKQ